MKLSIKLIGLLFILSLVSCGSESTPKTNGESLAKDVTVEEFKELIKTPGVILDVRTPGECQKGMIENAINIDYSGADFESEISNLDKSVPVYVYCASGGRSGRAMKEMSSLGFTQVYNLIGGYNAWK